jgi:prepilin peptidase CpaA
MSPAALALFCGVLLAAAASDLASRRIPNPLPAALALGAIVLGFPHDLGAALSRGGAFLLVGLPALGLYLAGALGGGDVKLLAAAALWMPLSSLPSFLEGLALAGGLQAAGAIALRAFAAPAPQRPSAMPYALSIAAAGLLWAAAQGVQP